MILFLPINRFIFTKLFWSLCAQREFIWERKFCFGFNCLWNTIWLCARTSAQKPLFLLCMHPIIKIIFISCSTSRHNHGQLLHLYVLQLLLEWSYDNIIHKQCASIKFGAITINIVYCESNDKYYVQSGKLLCLAVHIEIWLHAHKPRTHARTHWWANECGKYRHKRMARDELCACIDEGACILTAEL